MQKEPKRLSKDTHLTPSLWKGMRLQVSEGSMPERSAAGTSEDLASVPSNLAKKAWTTALGRGSTSTAAIPLRRSTGCGAQRGHKQNHGDKPAKQRKMLSLTEPLVIPQ